MKSLLLSLPTLFILGCATSQQSPPALQQVGNGLTAIGINIDSAAASVDAAQPHTDSIGGMYLVDAARHLTSAKQEAVATTREHTTALRQAITLTAERDTARSELKIERTYYIGYRARVWLRVIAVTAIIVLMVAGVINAETDGLLGQWSAKGVGLLFRGIFEYWYTILQSFLQWIVGLFHRGQ